jgi:hypothetical protein
MLRRYAKVFTLPAVHCYAYVDNTEGKVCIVHVHFFVSAKSIQNLQFAKNACVYPGRDHIRLSNIVLLETSLSIMTEKSKLMLIRHIFIEKSNNGTQHLSISFIKSRHSEPMLFSQQSVSDNWSHQKRRKETMFKTCVHVFRKHF